MMLPVQAPENEPGVVRMMRTFKADLLAREQAQMEAMAARWLEMEARLQAEIELLAREAAETGTLTITKATRLERSKSLLAQLRAEMADYEDYAEGLIRDEQRALGALGIEHSTAAIRGVYQEYGIFGAYFDVLPVRQIEFMVGLAADGSPLRVYLEQMYPNAVQGMLNALLEGVTRGINPREIAKMMADGLGIGINPALNTARTEQLRVYREAARMNYQNSGVVEGYQRISARDERVCPACLMADDGTVYPLDEPFAEHNQGRCSPVPVVAGLPPVRWQTGADWFKQQPAEAQERILGKERFGLWQAGAFELEQVVQRRTDAVWGDAFVPVAAEALR